MNFLHDLMKLRLDFLFTDLSQNFGKDWKKGKDCSETFIETKNKLESATWSHYKHHNTAGFLVCVFSNSSIALA